MGELSVMLTLSLLYGNILDPKTGKDQNGHHWSYVGESGPDHWVNHYPRCGGHRQSPVNINAGEVEYATWLTRLQFIGYERYIGHGTRPITIKNNGHTASMAITENLTLRGAHLNGDYKLAEMHLHWGSNNSIGSEHSIEGKKRPAEIHFVHYAERYGNLSEAMKMPDGLAVVGVFVELTQNDNYAVDQLCNGIEGILEYGKKTNLTNLRMLDFLPMNKNRFYHYRGSLTTPPCYESVLWFVMADSIVMSPRQLERFRYLQEKVHEHVAATGTSRSHSSRIFKSEPIYIRDNYRPQQQLYGRKVYSNMLRLDRPRLSNFELPSIQRTPINRNSISYKLHGKVHSTPNMNSNSHQNNRPDYIHRGLSPNAFNQDRNYGPSSMTGVISNGNNLLVGSIRTNNIKGAIHQHLQPDYKPRPKPFNEINQGHVLSAGNNDRLRVFKKPETASILSNELNGGKAAPLLDYIFTQMNGLTRNKPHNYNSNRYQTFQPKDRIFGGLSDLITNSATSRVLSNPFIDGSFINHHGNQGNNQNSQFKDQDKKLQNKTNSYKNFNFNRENNTKSSIKLKRNNNKRTTINLNRNNGSGKYNMNANMNPSAMSYPSSSKNRQLFDGNVVDTVIYPDYTLLRNDWNVGSMFYEEFL